MPTYRYNERVFQGRVVSWMNQVIERESLPFDSADQEVGSTNGRKYYDIILWKSKPSEIALLIELKIPEIDSWDIAGDTRYRAWQKDIPYFATWNINRFYWWDGRKSGDLIDILCNHKKVAWIKGIDEMDRVERNLRNFIQKFLIDFSKIYEGEKPLPLLSPDERFIARLRMTIDAFSIPVFKMIKDRYHQEPGFAKGLREWFAEQGWIFTAKDEDIEKASRQYVYLLIDKIMFYNTLRFTHGLPKIQISTGIDGNQLKENLQMYFNRPLREVDYETVFSTNFLDTIPVPDELVGQLRNFCYDISRWDFSNIGFEIMGRVFERLIPSDERHKLGQYFTRAEVVDLINAFCIKDSSDLVLDPGCGAGTFLVRGYRLKKSLQPARTHKELLDELWGIDIAKFPAHLATMNLCIKELGVRENYPWIFPRDFFDTKPQGRLSVIPPSYPVEGLDRKKLEKAVPLFDAVVLNPPYTRQEELDDIVVAEKEKAHTLCTKDWEEKMNCSHSKIAKRSSIYVYFFIHSAVFLNEGGRLGLITSNSWLDVEYGGDLQRFLLENFKIKAIIESQVERWFEEADVNTAITILERCKKKEERDENLVKFVYLKKKLEEFIPFTDSDEERFGAIEGLINRIEGADELDEDEGLRVYPVKQRELWEEGFDKEKGSYKGGKWGKYLRAPDIFFKVLERNRDILVPLREVAEVRFGIKTGANEFFHLPKPGKENKNFRSEMDSETGELVLKDKKARSEMFRIEKEYWMYPEEGEPEELEQIHEFVYKGNSGRVWIPNYVVKSPREIDKIVVEPRELKNVVLMVHDDKEELLPGIRKYVEWGEKQGFQKRPTCASRQRWYELEKVDAQILSRRFINTKFDFFINPDAFVGDTFFCIRLKEGDPKILGGVLNSSLYFFLTEIYGRKMMGQGVLLMYGPEIAPLPVFDFTKLSKSQIQKLLKAFDNLSKRSTGSVFEEIGADSPEEVSLDKVKSDRRELDKIVMGEILGLSEEEQLEVYEAVVGLVKWRLEKAKSVSRKKKKQKVDVDALVESMLSEVGEMRKFPDDYIGSSSLYETEEVPEGVPKVGSDIYGFYVDINGEKVRCKNVTKAKYIAYAVMNGATTVKVPVKKEIMEKAVKKYASELREAKKRINDFLESVPDKKVRKEVKTRVWRKLGIYEE